MDLTTGVLPAALELLAGGGAVAFLAALMSEYAERDPRRPKWPAVVVPNFAMLLHCAVLFLPLGIGFMMLGALIAAVLSAILFLVVLVRAPWHKKSRA